MVARDGFDGYGRRGDGSVVKSERVRVADVRRIASVDDDRRLDDIAQLGNGLLKTLEIDSRVGRIALPRSAEVRVTDVCECQDA